MKLSARGKYGLYAMRYLAQQEGLGPQTLRAIAETGVPEQYLEQLLGGLRRAGLVKTVRGAQGGYQLARAPEHITIEDIIDATEGPVALTDCLGDAGCPRQDECAVRGVWAYVNGRISDALRSVTLRDALTGGEKPESRESVS